ncbi:MAG: hypothetical protein LBN99_02050 [Oscillospiraceae bacterium]|jgi:hypothetical protein|nr:hypothetical protein [Oscillospiraceae bacterium]
MTGDIQNVRHVLSKWQQITQDWHDVQSAAFSESTVDPLVNLTSTADGLAEQLNESVRIYEAQLDEIISRNWDR